MGKGDKRTKKGKVFAGSNGKYRLKTKKNKKPTKTSQPEKAAS